EAGTSGPLDALCATVRVSVLPVRNRLHGIRPNGPCKHTARKVVDRYWHFGRYEGFDGSGKIGLVVYRVDPQQLVVGQCEPSVLKTHESYMVHEGEVTREPAARLHNPRRCDAMKDNADFDPLALVLQFQNAKDGLVKRIVRLDDV